MLTSWRLDKLQWLKMCDISLSQFPWDDKSLIAQLCRIQSSPTVTFCNFISQVFRMNIELLGGLMNGLG